MYRCVFKSRPEEGIDLICFNNGSLVCYARILNMHHVISAGASILEPKFTASGIQGGPLSKCKCLEGPFLRQS